MELADEQSWCAPAPVLIKRVVSALAQKRAHGRVKSSIDDGSDIPDTIVRDCVVHEFLAFKFPAVETGVVTVVYPIMLAPG